eukprot:gene16811-biopygen12834
MAGSPILIPDRDPWRAGPMPSDSQTAGSLLPRHPGKDWTTVLARPKTPRQPRAVWVRYRPVFSSGRCAAAKVFPPGVAEAAKDDRVVHRGANIHPGMADSALQSYSPPGATGHKPVVSNRGA